MESFLASRPTITKLGSSVKNLSGGAFTPMGEKKSETVAAAPKAANAALADHVQGSPPHGAAKAEGEPSHAVRVEVIRENGAVERIVVHCQCGERIEVDCLY